MNKMTVIALGTALMLVSAAAAAAETYRWVDAAGNVHYGDRPVSGSQEVDVRVAGETPSPPTVADNDEEFSDDTDDAFEFEEEAEDEGDVEAGDTEAEAESEAGPEDAAQVRAQLCEQARERLQRYEAADGLFEEGPDGKKRELSVDERVNTILKARQSVEDLCESPAG